MWTLKNKTTKTPPKNLMEKRSDFWLPESGGGDSQKMQASSCEISTGDVVCDVTTLTHTAT